MRARRGADLVQQPLVVGRKALKARYRVVEGVGEPPVLVGRDSGTRVV